MENKEKNFISAVIYVHNAETRIYDFLKMLINFFQANFENSEIICVNDSSNDNSIGTIKEACKLAHSTSITIVNLSYFHGLEVAMNAGQDLAIGDFVFEFDNTFRDFSEDDIMNVYKRSLEGFDIVSAIPCRKERLTSKIFYFLFNKFTKISLHTESFRIVSRRLINRITSYNRTIPYRKIIYTTAGLKTDSIEYNVTNNSGWVFDEKERYFKYSLALDSLILFTKIGFRFASIMTAFMILMTFFMIVYSIVIYFTARPVEGWTTTILFFSFAFFGLFGILSFVIRYLQLILNMLFKRKQYAFESIEKF